MHTNTTRPHFSLPTAVSVEQLLPIDCVIAPGIVSMYGTLLKATNREKRWSRHWMMVLTCHGGLRIGVNVEK